MAINLFASSEEKYKIKKKYYSEARNFNWRFKQPMRTKGNNSERIVDEYNRKNKAGNHNLKILRTKVNVSAEIGRKQRSIKKNKKKTKFSTNANEIRLQRS